MKLSTKGRYGLRALIDLAQNSTEEPVSITSIAERQEISERYLEQLMSKLKKSGIVKSIRGAAGGYILARPMEEISVGDILRALEGSLDPVDCAGLLEEGCKSAGQLCDESMSGNGSMTVSTGPWMRSVLRSACGSKAGKK